MVGRQTRKGPHGVEMCNSFCVSLGVHSTSVYIYSEEGNGATETRKKECGGVGIPLTRGVVVEVISVAVRQSE